MSAAVLETRALVKRFGAFVATDHVALRVETGARHALIGPNGAGKTTLLNLLTGVVTPSEGQILLDGRDITRMATHARVARGLVRTFQMNQLFGELTPLQSVALVVTRQQGQGRGWWRPLGRSAVVVERCEQLIDDFGLRDVMHQRTASLAYGKQRLLEVALAIACRPRVLLLDEPAAGVPESERHEIFEKLALLPAEVSVLLVEHDMDLVFRFARFVTVLVNGAILVEGDVARVAANPRVREVYLGSTETP